MKIIPSAFHWDRFLAYLRVLLGAGALVIEWLYHPHPSTFFGVALVVFLAYSLPVALRRRAQKGAFGLLVLFADTIFFLILADHGASSAVWLSSLFFLFLLAEALVFYGPRELLVVVAISLLFCEVAAGPFAMLAGIVLASGAVAVAFAVDKQRSADRIGELVREAEAAHETARKAAEAERQRIASDFHDGALQSIISLQMRLEILRKLLERDRDAGMDELQQLQSLAQSQVRELRAFVRSMRPVDVDGTNLFAAGRRIAENFQKESGIPVTFVGGDKPLALTQETATEVLQLLRESLNNVHKHAGATRVAVSMEKAGKALEIAVDDNGRGFHFSGMYNLEEMELLRLGPVSLKRRARSLNADMLVESRPGRGAGLRFRIPLQ